MVTKQQEQISLDLLRALALRQFNGEDFFILYPQDENESPIAYEGTEDEAREAFRNEIEGTDEAEIEVNFEIFCSNNLTEIDELEDDLNEDYRVLTDEEADEAMIEEVKEMAWAFNANFILEQCGLDYSGANSLRTMQAKLCEGANDFILSLIEKCTSIEDFAQAAASADGRGHFLARYDGNENEETVMGKTFYIYRNN